MKFRSLFVLNKKEIEDTENELKTKVIRKNTPGFHLYNVSRTRR